MTFITQCFSGECGLCGNCHDSNCSSISDLNGSDSAMDRAKDLSKVLGAKRVDTITMNYNSVMKKWCKQRGYRNPTDIGWTNRTVKMNHVYGTYEYKLIQTKHASVCDDSLCKAMYVNSSVWLHKSYYTSIPVYALKGKDDKFLCGPCLSGRPPLESNPF